MNIKKPDDPQDLLSASEVAKMLPDTSAQTVLRWAKQGLLPFIELPSTSRRRKYFRRSDIEALLRPVAASAPSAGSAAEPPGAPGEVPGQGALWSAPSPAGGGGRVE